MTNRKATRILVVEDEKLVAMDLRHTLNALGYEVTGVADNWEDAIDQANVNRPDIALLDIKIVGEKDGTEVGRHLRDVLDIPCVYLTAHSDNETLARAGVTEPYGYILKPFEERDLRVGIEIGLFKHQSEQKQKQVEHWLASALYSLGEGVLATDTHGRVIFVNPVAEMMFEMTHAQIQGVPIDRLFRTAFDLHGNAVREALTRALHEETVIHPSQDVFLLTRSQEEVPIVFTAAPIRDQSSQVNGVVVGFRRAQPPSEQAAVGEAATKRLLEAQKLECIGTMAGGIANDFTNRLMAIIGSAGILKAKSTESENREIIAEIEKQGAEAALLCEQLTGLSANEKPKLRPVDLSRTIEDAMEYYLSLIPRDVKLLLRPGADNVIVRADPGSLRRIVSNIFENAIDVMPEDDGLITIKTEIRQLNAAELEQAQVGEQLQPGAYGVLGIENNGPPIPADLRRRIFDPFFTMRALGRGMGLAEVANLVRNLDAGIIIRSDDDYTAFEIILPIAPDAAVASPAPTSDTVFQYRPPTDATLLLIENNRSNRTILAAMLKQLGYGVRVAASGTEALKEYAQNPAGINGIISDLAMPELDGLQVAEKIRETRPDLPILLMTGLIDERHAAVPESLGINAILNKPVAISTLRRELEACLEPATIK